MVPITQGMLIGFSGAALYFVVDRYEPDKGMAAALKFLVVLLGAAAASLHRFVWRRIFLITE
jgi:hypothetical protein